MPTEKGVATGDVRGGEMGQQQDGSDLQHENSNYMIFEYREMETDTVSAKGTDMFPTRIQALGSALRSALLPGYLSQACPLLCHRV